MCEQMKRITQYYKTLEYEINKLEALKKISTLHNEVKLKDVNDFSDRFFQTASVIEKNLSVFKAACDHVDIITTIIEHLYTFGNRLRFDNDLCNLEVNIIYMMFMICNQPEIPLFLKATLINNSKYGAAYLEKQYTDIISDYVFEIIVLEDSDLYAVISYLKTKCFSLLKLKTIFVQISIKQKFLWLIEQYFKIFISSDLSISVFQSKEELFSPLSFFTKLSMISIWSEDIIAAKELAMTLNKDITFINAHMEYCHRMTFSYVGNVFSSVFNMTNMYHLLCQYTDKDKINPNAGSIYNLFYDGAWQKPVKDTYWIHNNNTYAQATNEDVFRCLQSAEKASKNWSTCPISSRIQTLLNLANTLECNGKFLLANTVLKWIKYLTVYNVISYHQDERLEVINILVPKGIVSLQHCDETVLFTYLTLALIIGNCVVVICNQNSCTLAPYCNMFSTSEIPPGVINLLSNKDLLDIAVYPDYRISDVIRFCSSWKHIVLPLK